jgi:thiamine-monophosphate kinase
VRGLVLGSGDDAAITEREGATATSVDALVEGVHFRVPPFALREVGAKALSAALSDLAAMGAEPAEAYVELGLPERFDDEALALADGIGAVAAREGVALAGGDVTRSPVLFLAVTAVGSATDAAALVRRAGAREADVVAITGEVGGAAAGLQLLERPELAEGLDEAVAARLRARQLEPRPLLAAGRALAESGASAMIDVSDGVVADASHLAEASGVALALEMASVPIQAGVAEVASAAGRDVVELALGGGEDYELLVTLPAARIDEATGGLAAVGSALTVIGAVGAGSGVELREPGGRRREVPGYDQLEASRARPGRA